MGLREAALGRGLILYDTKDHLCSLSEANILAGGFQDGKLRTRFRCHHGQAEPRYAVNT